MTDSNPNEGDVIQYGPGKEYLVEPEDHRPARGVMVKCEYVTHFFDQAETYSVDRDGDLTILDKEGKDIWFYQSGSYLSCGYIDSAPTLSLPPRFQENDAEKKEGNNRS